MHMRSRRLPNFIAVALLTFLCGLFFWRLLTPNLLNQQSLIEGDFSGQFVAFAHYQAIRLGAGEIPLWNPYNNGGSPFLADTQSAVFYPPRLLTIAIVNLSGGSTPGRMYDALQKEMVAHVWLASLLMYFFVRRLTHFEPANTVSSDKISYRSITPPFAAAITFAYGGYLMGYPELQLAVMEAGVWLPLALLAVHAAIAPDSPLKIGRLMLAGFALGLSFLAGHPQTTLFFIYVTLAYLGWRIYLARRHWTVFLAGAILIGGLGGAIGAVQLLPGWEFTRLTARSASFNFDAMGNGFPFYDPLQVIFPGIFSLWTPLYFGIAGLLLLLLALWKRTHEAIFWGGVLLVALGLSYGHSTIVYDVFYNFLPGFSLFRGQERAAYVIAIAAAVLVGLGMHALLMGDFPKHYKLMILSIPAIAVVLFVILFVNWQITNNNKNLGLVAFSLIVSGLAVLIVTAEKQAWRPAALVGLMVFELFSFGRTNPNLETKPAIDRLAIPSLTAQIQNDKNGVYHVEGVGENYGTLYGIADIQGTSPLRLATVERLLNLPTVRRWDVFAVRYAIAETPDAGMVIAKEGTKTLVKVDAPRPFARLVYKTWVEPNDDQALGYFRDPSFDAAHTVLLNADPGVKLPDTPPSVSDVQITYFAPEKITLNVNTGSPAILDIALPVYPGWHAQIDGAETPILRADTAMTAIVVPVGQHTIQLTYTPSSFTIGAIISIAAIGFILILILVLFVSRRSPLGSSDKEN
jgi:hypothetical protein